jgi:streptogramin lyase
MWGTRGPFVGTTAALLIALVLLMADEERQTPVLRHFVTLPAGLLAEGLAVHDGLFFVGTFSFTASDGTILVFDESGAIVQTFTVPGLPAVGQLAFADDDTLFAVAGNLGTGQGGSVVRIDLDSGAVTTFATGFQVPNGIAIDGQGNLFVTDLLAGNISEVTPDGVVSNFASSLLLAPALVPPLGINLGTNDLAFNARGTALYVTNVGQGTVVTVEIREDGTAGAITIFAQVPTPDGVAFDRKGNLYVTSPFTNSIWVVSRDGSARQLSFDTSQESLNNPSNVAFQGHVLYVTNLGLSGASTISVFSVRIPGLPLGEANSN